MLYSAASPTCVPLSSSTCKALGCTCCGPCWADVKVCIRNASCAAAADTNSIEHKLSSCRAWPCLCRKSSFTASSSSDWLNAHQAWVSSFNFVELDISVLLLISCSGYVAAALQNVGLRSYDSMQIIKSLGKFSELLGSRELADDMLVDTVLCGSLSSALLKVELLSHI